jgi:hypothetical protein
MNYHRENANWLKLNLIGDNLEDGKYDYYLFLDADVIMLATNEDPTDLAIAELVKSGKDVMFADEDWHKK